MGKDNVKEFPKKTKREYNQADVDALRTATPEELARLKAEWVAGATPEELREALVFQEACMAGLASHLGAVLVQLGIPNTPMTIDQLVSAAELVVGLLQETPHAGAKAKAKEVLPC